MKEEEKKPLSIPANCPPVEYVINGFTKSDMSYVIGAGIATFVMAIMVYANTKDTIKAVAIGIMGIAMAVIIFHRDLYTENLIDKIRILLEYNKSPKSYIYRYVDKNEKIKMKENEKIEQRRIHSSSK